MKNVDENSEMIATNEVTLTGKHTESHDINENYMETLSKFIDSSTTEKINETTISSTTEITNSTDSLSKIISVICIWC